MKRIVILLVFILLNKSNAFTYNDQHGVNIVYNITFVSECRLETDTSRFRRIVGGGLPACVRECGLRPHCEALSYGRRIPLCDLFGTAGEGDHTTGDCTFILASDIKVIKKPCQNCFFGQVCDIHSKECIYEECLGKEIDKGSVLGNVNEVGSKIRYKCNYGYKGKNKVETAICQNNGTWTATADCEIVYRLVTDAFNWWEAMSNCETLGGRLADIKSEEEQNFIEKNIFPATVNWYWIGGNKMSDRFTWLDGSDVSEGYQNWSPGQPNIIGGYGEENCMIFGQSATGYTWHDAPCSWRLGSLCEFD